MQGITDWDETDTDVGINEVVREWGRLKTELASPVPATGSRSSASSDSLCFSDDAGYPDTQLGRGDLLRLFVTDIDEYM